MAVSDISISELLLLVIDNDKLCEAARFAAAVFDAADQILRERSVAAALNDIPFD